MHYLLGAVLTLIILTVLSWAAWAFYVFIWLHIHRQSVAGRSHAHIKAMLEADVLHAHLWFLCRLFGMLWLLPPVAFVRLRRFRERRCLLRWMRTLGPVSPATLPDGSQVLTVDCTALPEPQQHALHQAMLARGASVMVISEPESEQESES